MSGILRLTRFVGIATLMLGSATTMADWQYNYYEGSWSTLPNFATLPVVANGSASVVSTAPALRADNFGLRFTNQITVTVAGFYQFSTNSDDGSQLLIDGTIVVDNNGLHGPQTRTGTIYLNAGSYQMEIRFFERTGGQLLEASYSPAGSSGFRSIPADGILDGPDNVAETGTWGEVIPWPHVPVSAANMPDGKVLTWASNERYSFPGGRPEFTFTAVWDPADGSITEIDHPSHDMFCAHQVMLEDGQVFVSGGRNSGNSPWTSVFDRHSNTWVPLNNMNRGRWYPTSVALADGTVFTAIGSGGGNTGEVYQPDSGDWQLLSGIDFNPLILNYSSNNFGERNWWPLFGLMPDGRIFHAGPTPQMHIIDTSGVGSAVATGPEFTDWYPKHGTTVMYDEGKLLTAGGWVTGQSISSTNEAHTIDLNGPSPDIAVTNPMIYPRKFHNSVMLPNGEVLVIGGNTSGQKFNDSGTVYASEIWNPTTGQWRETAAMSVPRNYHSVALMLTDGTVLSAGGGLCNCTADHPDGQIFYPPYLYNQDGTLATRPTVLTAPSAIRAGDTFDVTTDTDISHFSLIKMSSTTHAVNTDLRYLTVPHTGSAGEYQLAAHANPNVLTPGYWMLFALNAQGTPSVAEVIQVRATNATDPEPRVAADLEFGSFADLNAFQLNGQASGIGGALRLTAAQSNSTGTAFYRTPFQISSATSFVTSMSFSMHGAANGSEGLALVLQGNESSALGEGGAGLGIGNVANSLIIELDVSANANGDANGNHVAVHVGGDLDDPVAFANAPFDLEDGSQHRIWVEYSASLNELKVYLANDPAAPRPQNPLMTVGNLDLPAKVGSLGYFGFSAATSTSPNNHDIHSWSVALTAGEEPLVIEPIAAPPQPVDGSVNFSAAASGIGLQYSWSFGDGSPQTLFSSSPDISHEYAAPGRYVVTLIVRDANGAEQTYQFVQAVYPPLTLQKPVSSTTILVVSGAGSEQVWNVNPDNNSVSVIDGLTGSLLAEISVGNDPRALAMVGDGTIWVTNKDDATVSIIDTSSRSVVGLRTLPAGSRPHGIVGHVSSGNVYIALEQLGEVIKLSAFDPSFSMRGVVGNDPRHLSLMGDESRLYVSRFISPPFPDEHTLSPRTSNGGELAGGEVIAVDPATLTASRTIVLQHSNRQPAEITGPGFPNYLGPAIISPSGSTAWVPSKQDEILAGLARNNTPLSHDHTVRAVTSVIDLATESESPGDRVDHDNSSTARNGAFDPYGIYLFVVLEGNREVAVVDAFSNQEVLRFDVGLAPQGVAVSGDGVRVFVHNFMNRSVSIIDSYELINGLSETVEVLGTVSTTSTERLSAEVLLGKQLFYDARDPRLALESYMSCASCHNDGGHDGRVWDLSSMGEGLRNTISLKGHSGIGHGKLHWTANFDEVQDFENQIRDLAGGTGLMSDSDFAATSELLGPPKTGLSADLDALAAYVASLGTFEPSPYRGADGSLTTRGELGKAIFQSANCTSCHSGADFSDSATGQLHDIGTLDSASGQRMGATLSGLDTPTLKGLWATAPYLHNGSALNLREAVLAHNSAALGGRTFTDSELQDLVSYLLQIDDREVADAAPDTSEPTIPQNVIATASGPRRVVISWDLSTDDGTGVGGYFVYRDGGGTAIASVSGQSYVDTTVSPSTTYSYEVAAYDNAAPSNVSGRSTAATVTTPEDAVIGVPLSKSAWTISFVDSAAGSRYAASNAIDSNLDTMWHTQWSPSSPPPPHEIHINLGDMFDVDGFVYTPRTDGVLNGTIGDYEFYVSLDGANWGAPVAAGSFAGDSQPQEVRFPINQARYVRLRALTEANGNPWTSVAEIDVLGTAESTQNSPPDGVIHSPASNTTIRAGEAVDFQGSSSDVDGNYPLSFRWQFGAGSGVANVTLEDPGPIQFDIPGSYTVTFTVTDAEGASDPTPSSVVIIVEETGNVAPNGSIDSPAGNVTVDAGQTVAFNGSGSDPDGNTPLTYSWSFGEGSGIADSSLEDPGAVQFDIPGVYTVSLTVSDSLGRADASPAMRSITVIDPNGGTAIPKSGWTLLYADSEAGSSYAATRSFDGDLSTMWHTQWSPSNVPPPHEIQINLNGSFLVDGFIYTPRQDGEANGTIGDYEFYVSMDGTNWHSPVASGRFTPDQQAKEIRFPAVQAQYVRLRAVSEVNGNAWTSMAEFDVLGTANGTANLAPDGVIDTPVGDASIAVGQSINFTGSGNDSDGNLPLAYRWVFGSGSGVSESLVEDPGVIQFDIPGTFVVEMTVTDAAGLDDETPARRVISVVDPSGGGPAIPKSAWSLVYADSQANSTYAATSAFDTRPDTMWHTQWQPSSPLPPHEIQIDLNASYQIDGFVYTPRQDGEENGTIATYEFYVSSDGENWGAPVATGTFSRTLTPQEVRFAAVTGRYVRLLALSEINGEAWTSIAELDVMGFSAP